MITSAGYDYRTDSFNNLIGKQISSVHCEDKKLTFYVDKEAPVVFVPYGDCCSELWIENDDLSCFDAATLLSVEAISGGYAARPMNSNSYVNNTRTLILYQFNTSKGTARVSYINESDNYQNTWLQLQTKEKKEEESNRE